MKYILSLVCFLIWSGFCLAQQTEIEKEWAKFYPLGKNIVREAIKKKTEVAGLFAPLSEEAKWSNCAGAINCVANRIQEAGGIKLNKSALKRLLREVDMSSPFVLKVTEWEKFIENYYALKFISEGAPAEEAWGSMWFNTTVETIGNKYDYKRYEQILESGNPEFISAYLVRLKQVFRYNGYTLGLEKIRPVFEQNFPEGTVKQEILDLYALYYHLREGASAPAFSLKDFKGNVHTLADYKGKVLVIDVWATWCGGCILKLPEFMKMREAYKGRDDIEFITISIDQSGSFKTWKYALPRLKLMDITNLLASPEKCSFSKDYNITGIPRYFLLDKDGKIVTVYAPTPGKDFRKLIDEILARSK